MDKKYEQLIDLIINENDEKARELFHEIIVEKSREIYESIMEEDIIDTDICEDDLEMGGEVGDLADEISAEEDGIDYEDDEYDELDIASDEETVDFDDVDDGSLDSDDEVEDAVIRIEDKLDQLMAEFESMMSDDETSMDDVEDVDTGDSDDEEVDFDVEDDEELSESVQLQKVSVTHGDNGENTKSPVAANSGKAGADSKPVTTNKAEEKGRTSPTAKDVEGAKSFKNAPGQKKQSLASAPKPETKQAQGVNTKSPVAK